MTSRDGSKYTFVYGIRAVETLLTRQIERIRSIWVCGADDGPRQRLVELSVAHQVPIQSMSKKKFEDRVGRVNHQWIAAEILVAEYRPWSELLEHPSGLIVAIDQVTDPRNLGSIIRSAEAMGATGCLITRNRCARLGPTVAKTSAGASELLPVAMEANLARSLRSAQASGYVVIGAALDGLAPDELDMTAPTVIVIGAEGSGIRRLTRATCDEIVTIPLPGLTESLNAGSAAGILVYEAARQRLNFSRSQSV